MQSHSNSCVCVCFRYFYRACQGTLFPSPMQVGRQLDKLPLEIRKHFLSQSKMKLGSVGSVRPPRPQLFPFCRPFFKDCSFSVRHTHSTKTKRKDKVGQGGPVHSKGMEMKDTPVSSKDPENRPIHAQRAESRGGKQGSGSPNSEPIDSRDQPTGPDALNESCTLPYPKGPPRAGEVSLPAGPATSLSPEQTSELGWLTSTPLPSQSESVQLISPSSGGPPGVTYKKNQEVMDWPNQSPLLPKGDEEPSDSTDCLQEHSKPSFRANIL